MKQSSSKPSRGGSRPGAGRKPSPADSTVRTVTVSISMPPADLARLDHLRGELPRGKFIVGLLP